MFGYRFGYRGHSRRSVFQSAGVGVSESVSQHGVTFDFATPRPVGQYTNGDWWVLGPVSITSISPESTLHNGVNGAGTPYTNRVVHGAMLNPGNRSFATGGLTTNNTTNTVQGWDSIASSIGFVAYNAAANVDPGRTGTPLTVTSGSVVKFVSRLTALPNGAQNRPAGLDIVVLTVVDAIPAADAIRPGVSRAGNKASPARLSQFDLGVFQNLAATASTPTFAEALDWIDRYHETAMPDSINNPTAKAINNHPEYGRNIGNNLHRAMLCLHLSSFTAEQKRTLLSHMAAIADDIVSRMEEGAVVLGGGGGNQWKKPVVALCAASLGANAPASWLTYLRDAEQLRWGEDSQNFAVSPFDIALPRFAGDGRPRSPYTFQMLGSIDWGEAHSYQPERDGSNWDSFYRDIVNYSLFPGLLAVELTAGGKAAYGNPELWTYYDTVYLRRTEGSPGNVMLPFGLEMTNAFRPAKATAPVIAEAGIRDAAIWLRFDLALNETAAAPATSAFIVNVNGSPVTVSQVSIWRQNIGLTLAAAVTGNDVVTVDYTVPGSNPARSVDGVNIASFTGQALTNRTEKVGGPNAAFPVVAFGAGVSRRLGAMANSVFSSTGIEALAPANSALGTLALLKFRFEGAPPANRRILGFQSGTAPLRIWLNINRTLELDISNAAGTRIIRIATPALAAGVDHDILFSVDATQTTGVNGVNCYVNGVAQALTIATWAGGAGVTLGWSRKTPQGLNPDGNAQFRIGALWLDTTMRVDLTNSANRTKFTSMTGGNLDIGTLGDGITGMRPAQFLVGNADQWNSEFGINRGSGNRFFPTSGVVGPVSGAEWA